MPAHPPRAANRGRRRTSAANRVSLEGWGWSGVPCTPLWEREAHAQKEGPGSQPGNEGRARFGRSPAFRARGKRGSQSARGTGGVGSAPFGSVRQGSAGLGSLSPAAPLPARPQSPAPRPALPLSRAPPLAAPGGEELGQPGNR